MSIENKNTRYFIEIDCATLEIIRVGSDHKEYLNRGHQDDPGIHRLFLSAGQYSKFVSRCEDDLQSVLDA